MALCLSYAYRNVSRKVGRGARSQIMRKSSLSLAHIIPLLVCLVAAWGNAQEKTAKAGTAKTQGSQVALNCTASAECPSGQRCGFTSGCKSKGRCVIPSHAAHCIDPGGRCGCDGRPVDIFCKVGSRTEYTSAPTNALGPCPKPCSEQIQCRTGLVCQKGFCIKP
jgi:hypothetical protein